MALPLTSLYPDNISVLIADLANPGSNLPQNSELREMTIRALGAHRIISLHYQATDPAPACAAYDYWLVPSVLAGPIITPGEFKIRDAANTAWLDITPALVAAATVALGGASGVLAATQAEVDAGLLTSVYVSPATLKDVAIKSIINTWSLANVPGLTTTNVGAAAFAAPTRNTFTASTWAAGSFTVAASEAGAYAIGMRAGAASTGRDAEAVIRINGVAQNWANAYTSVLSPVTYVQYLTPLAAGDVVSFQTRNSAGPVNMFGNVSIARLGA